MLTSLENLGNPSSPRRCSVVLSAALPPLFLMGNWGALDLQARNGGGTYPSPPCTGEAAPKVDSVVETVINKHCCFHRWQLNGSDVDLSAGDRYALHGGSLVVSDPRRSRDAGTYRCFATNPLGTIVSREARLQFACRCGRPCVQGPLCVAGAAGRRGLRDLCVRGAGYACRACRVAVL